MHSHFIIRCKNCQKVISQCRCMGPKKESWSLCDSCKAGQGQNKKGGIPDDICGVCYHPKQDSLG